MLKINAKTGMPFLLVFLKIAGIVPSLLRDHNILVDAYKPELAAEIIAVSTTKFKPQKAHELNLRRKQMDFA